MGISRTWRIGIVLFAVASLAASLATGASVEAATLLVPEGQGPGGRALYAWEAGKSWQGGEQHDPRLDDPVSCWRAGVSLPDLFADIAEQTGVAIGFWPRGDENRRVRVHVFLNPDEPPTLRDLMAQLTWVTDCTFGWTGGGAATSYYLLGTSIAQGAAAALRQREMQARQTCEGLLQAIKDRRGQIEEALQLPREEAIDLYLGRDNALLLTALDPARRTVAQIVSERLNELLETIRFDPSLPPDSTQSFGATFNLYPLPQEEKDALAEVFADYDVDYDSPKAWCPLIVDSHGRVLLGPPRYHGDPVESWPGREAAVTVMDLSGDIHSRPKDEVTLRRALGEAITPDEEEAYVERREEEIAADERSARRHQAGGRSLSDEVRELLENTALSLPTGTHPAWAIEEAVGTATGLHLIADGLLDAKADLTGSGAKMIDLSALSALKVFCDTPGRDFMRSPEWEWGDAGRFLAFRTANRDIWRAAMLPQGLLDWLDGEIEPCLPGPDTAGERAETAEFDLPVNPEGWTFWSGRVSEVQIRYGARVPYGEPGDLLDAARRSAWGAAFALAKEYPAMLRFLGSLHSAQWESAHAGILEAPADLSPDQMKLLQAAIEERSSWNLHLPEDSSITISITQGECEANVLWMQTTGAAGGGQTYTEDEAGAVDWYRVHLTGTGLPEGEHEEPTILRKQVPFLPVSIAVHADVGT